MTSAEAITLHTSRLSLRRFTLDDLEDYYRLGADPVVNRYTGNDPFKSMEQARETLLNAPLRDYEEYGFGRMAVIERASGRFIGFNGLKYLPEIDEIDIGYRFFRDAWGQGFATESSLAVMEYGRGPLGLERIVAIVDPENAASVNVIKKLGLSYEKKVHLGSLPEMDLYA